jgi:hypothetical protein
MDYDYHKKPTIMVMVPRSLAATPFLSLAIVVFFGAFEFKSPEICI